MSCTDNHCECVQDLPGLYLTEQINKDGSYATNLQPGSRIGLVFKPYGERETPDCIQTNKDPHIIFISVHFYCKVSLSSLVIRSTFKDINVYSKGNVNQKNWSQIKPEKHYFLQSDKHLTELPLTSSAFTDVSNLKICLFGNESIENSLFYIGFKGSYSKKTEKEIGIKYELYSSEKLIEKNTSENNFMLH